MPKKKTAKKISPKKELDDRTNSIYNLILTGSYPVTSDRIAIGKSVAMLRSLENKKDEHIEFLIFNAYKQCRIKVLKIMIETILNNRLRLSDIPTLMDMIAPEMILLSAWEYEHIEASDDMLAPKTQEDTAGRRSALELFSALGGDKTIEDDKDDDN